MGVLSAAEAAEVAGLNVEVLRRYMRAGRLPFKRIGRTYIIDEAALRRWLAKPRPVGRPPELSRRNRP